jgi:hypothetical protein
MIQQLELFDFEGDYNSAMTADNYNLGRIEKGRMR